MAEDLNDQSTERIKENTFGLQLNETTNTNKDAHLICYVRFMDGVDTVEDLLVCKIITASAKGLATDS